MIEAYVPKFAKDYYDINGSQQYSMFASVALGIKKSYDDWIYINQYDEFVEMCKKYNLVVEPGVVFVQPDKRKEEITGGSNLTTTFAKAQRFKEASNGNVHVFVAQNKPDALDAKRFGWYPVEASGACINKPFIDHLRFGKQLGFPDCCVDFFRKFNDWNRFSHPRETLRNTKNDPSYYCNNFLMDLTYNFIHHLPCSYNCDNTIAYAKKVEEAMQKVEPEFVKKTKELLKKPLLVFGERHFIIFDGTLEQDLKYTDSQYCTNPARPEEAVSFYDKIRNGNLIKTGDKIRIYKDKELLHETNMKKNWFLIGFK